MMRQHARLWVLTAAARGRLVYLPPRPATPMPRKPGDRSAGNLAKLGSGNAFYELRYAELTSLGERAK